MSVTFQTDPVFTTTADPKASHFDEQLKEMISSLIDLWKPYHREGLTIRHETGRMLNELMGPLSKRQEYGEGVLAKVAKQVHVSRSELSRMRKFAEAIPDLDAFRRDRTECSTWTKVKMHLATIDEKGQPVFDKATSASPAKGVCRSIRTLTTKVKGVESNSNPDDRQRVITALQALAQAVRDAFGVTIQVETEQDSVSTNDPHKGAPQAA